MEDASKIKPFNQVDTAKNVVLSADCWSEFRYTSKTLTNVDPAWQLTESLATSTWITDPATESWYKLKL